MKKVLVLFVILLMGMAAYTDLPKRLRSLIVSEDLAIGQTSTPDASAALEIESDDSGVLMPRMTTTEKNSIGSPAEGLFLYDETLQRLEYYDGSSWEPVGAGDFDSLAPTTTKGDIIVYNGTTNIRLPVGTDDQALVADSGEASGLRFSSSGIGNVVSAAGSGSDVCYIRIANSGTPSVTSDSGCLDDSTPLTDNGTGDTTLNFETTPAAWANVPTCVCSAEGTTNPRICMIEDVSTSIVRTQIQSATPATADEDFNVICYANK